MALVKISIKRMTVMISIMRKCLTLFGGTFEIRLWMANVLNLSRPCPFKRRQHRLHQPHPKVEGNSLCDHFPGSREKDETDTESTHNPPSKVSSRKRKSPSSSTKPKKGGRKRKRTSYNCSVCQYETLPRPFLKAHSKIHSPSSMDVGLNGYGPVSCRSCRWVMTSDVIKFHIGIHHEPHKYTKVVKRSSSHYQCNFCSYKTEVRKTMNSHSRRHRPGNKQKKKKKPPPPSSPVPTSDNSGSSSKNEEQDEDYNPKTSELEHKKRHSKSARILSSAVAKIFKGHKGTRKRTWYKYSQCGYETSILSQSEAHLRNHSSTLPKPIKDFISFPASSVAG